MSRAILRYVRVSPTKARLVAREVQGMNAELALASLEFMPNKAAGIISKVIASAVANGEYEPEDVVITSCRVDKASVLKRWRPRARGMATRILKPTSHIYVEVAKISEVENKKDKKSSKKAKSEPKNSEATKVDEGKKPKEEEVKSSSDTSLPPSSLMGNATQDTKAEDSTMQKASLTSNATAESAANKENSKATATKRSKTQKAQDGDDLTKIKGIGKVYQERLHSEGIFTFEQVANMNDEQIEMMETKYSFKGDFRDSVAHAKEIINRKEA
jgi:large subunit ribosomal protein L22